jgi:ribose 5-phosphate isomerase RpiB
MKADGHTLRWSGRVLAAEDLRRNLNGHRAVVVETAAVVTPLAAEELRSRGIGLDRADLKTGSTGYAQDRPYPLIASVVVALRRAGICLQELSCEQEIRSRWSHAIATRVARGDCRSGVVFCEDPALVCCVANKVSGLRAAAVATINQAARAARTLGANLLAVEMPGRTYFEILQILRVGASACPDDVAETLRGLDGHAHR